MLIKYATKSRPQWFRKAIANIIATVSDPNYEVLISADHDDITMFNPNMLQFIKAHPQLTLVFGDSKSKIDAINRDMEVAGDWDFVVNTSDDMFFNSFGWDNIIRQRMKDNFPEGDCFLHFNDGYTGDLLPTMSIMDRKYYNRDGYIYHPSYKSFSCDAEAMYVAMMRGRYKYFDEIIALHQHPSNTPQTNDSLYQANSLHTSHDVANYFERLKNYFAEPSGHEILKARPELKQYL